MEKFKAFPRPKMSKTNVWRTSRGSKTWYLFVQNHEFVTHMTKKTSIHTQIKIISCAKIKVTYLSFLTQKVQVQNPFECYFSRFLSFIAISNIYSSVKSYLLVIWSLFFSCFSQTSVLYLTICMKAHNPYIPICSRNYHKMTITHPS